MEERKCIPRTGWVTEREVEFFDVLRTLVCWAKVEVKAPAVAQNVE